MKSVLVGLSAALLAGACSDSAPGDCKPSAGNACTWAGVRGSVGFNGDGLKPGASWLYYPADLTFAPDGAAWIADWNNHRVRRVMEDGTLQTMVGTDYEGDGSPGETDRLPVGNPMGAVGTTVALNHPMQVEFFPDGRVLLAAWHNNKLRVYDPATQLVKVLVGNSYGFGGDGEPAYMGLMNLAKAAVIDTDGTVYTIDQRNQRIRKVSNDAVPMITTIAGNGTIGSTGDGGPASMAQLAFNGGSTPIPSGALAIKDSKLYIANTEINNIRVIDLTTGIIDCVAGCSAGGQAGYTGDGGSAKTATFNYPMDLDFGPDGRLYVADRYNNAIRAIDLTADMIETVAGNGQPCAGPEGTCIEKHDGVKALDLQLDQPYGIGFDQKDMYIADTLNSRIVRVGL